MRSLVLCYSRTGTTKKVATALAESLGAELAELRCDRYPPGARGYVRAAYDSIRRRLAPISAPPAVGRGYDLAIIASPIWTSYLAVPVLSFLKGRPKLPGKVAVVLTRIGSPADRALEEIAALLPSPPVARLALTSKEVDGPSMRRGSAPSPPS